MSYIRCLQTTCTTFGTCKLHTLHSVYANYMHYIRYMQTTCTTFGTCKLHVLHSVPANYMCYIRYMQITCAWYIFSLFITVSSFFCYFNRSNQTGKYTNRPNIMKIPCCHTVYCTSVSRVILNVSSDFFPSKQQKVHAKRAVNRRWGSQSRSQAVALIS